LPQNKCILQVESMKEFIFTKYTVFQT